MSSYSPIGSLPLRVEAVEVEDHQLEVSTDFTRHTSVLMLSGGGHRGYGEDVMYRREAQELLRRHAPTLNLQFEGTLEGFSRHLDTLDLLGAPIEETEQAAYRRWTFESAALDLALRQSETTLAQVVERTPRPVRFVASCGLGTPATLEPVRKRRERVAGMRFKLDWNPSWTRALMEELAGLDCVDVIDFKGQYRGVFQGPPADVEAYRLIAEILPDAWLEDPDWNDEIAEVLAPHADRVTWDAPVHSIADLQARPTTVRMVNVKPSRFGTLRALFDMYDYCAANDIGMYGGGQFELSVGRDHILYLASLFHADAPNDVAPTPYHQPFAAPVLPASPVTVEPASIGFLIEEI